MDKVIKSSEVGVDSIGRDGGVGAAFFRTYTTDGPG